MWESAPYIPRLLSPHWALSLWGLCLAVILLVSVSRYRPYAGLLARALGMTVILQSLVFGLGLAVGTWLRHRGENPNDVYVLGAVVGGLIWIGTIGAVVGKARRIAPVIATAPQAAPDRVLRGAVFTLTGTVVVILLLVFVGPLWLLLLALAISYQGPWSSEMLQGLSIGIVVVALVLLRAGGRGSDPGPSPRVAYLLSSLLIVSSVALIGVQLRFPVVPAAAMTDGALVSGKATGGPLGSLLGELRSRPPARWSALEHSVRSIRKGAGVASLGARIPRVLILLEVLVARGDLEEPQAWLDDPEVPAGLRVTMAKMLAEKDRPGADCRPGHFLARVGQLCSVAGGGAPECFDAFRDIWRLGACNAAASEKASFAAAYAWLRMHDSLHPSTNITADVLLSSEERDAQAAALGVKVAATKDPQAVKRWARLSRYSASGCSAIARVAQISCPSTPGFTCSTDATRGPLPQDHADTLVRCLHEASAEVPAELAKLADY